MIFREKGLCSFERREYVLLRGGSMFREEGVPRQMGLALCEDLCEFYDQWACLYVKTSSECCDQWASRYKTNDVGNSCDQRASVT
jgi:hypothetical protein